MFDLDLYLFNKKKQIDTTLEQIFHGQTNSARISDAIRYSVMAGGKRLRPTLCLAAIEASGGNSGEVLALKVACSLEMIHTYSLIHDDLPAMDNDDLRRGVQTCHIAFDESTAILAGDALVTLAFHILSDIKCENKNQALKILDIIRIISYAAGHNGMIAGQMLDISSEGALLSLEELTDMYRLKTGALIESSIHAGAILGEASADRTEQLIRYAENIGLAFQITDDILNIQGDPAIMGKAAGTDKIRNKNTCPSIIGIEQAGLMVEKFVTNALHALKDFDNRSDPLRAIATYIIKREK